MRKNSEQSPGQINQAGGWLARILKPARVAPLVAMLLFASSLGAHAVAPATANVTLAWNANTEANLAGYRLYYGTAAQVYSDSVLVGAAVTTATVSNLLAGQTYYFALKATNLAGLESIYSSEVAYVVPPVTAPVATIQVSVTANGQTVLTVKGPVGHTYDIQASPDLSSGAVVIGTVTVGANGSVQFIDTNATVSPSGFYSLVEVLRANVQIRVGPAREVVLTVAGTVGHAYDIEASADFKTWAVIGNVTMGAGGSVEFTDTNAPNFPKRFYRARDTQP